MRMFYAVDYELYLMSLAEFCMIFKPLFAVPPTFIMLLHCVGCFKLLLFFVGFINI